MDAKRIAKAIEKDAGKPIEGLHESIEEMKAGKFARTYTPEQLLLRDARQALALSQVKFADLIDTPVAKIRDWEQGRFKHSGSVIFICKVAIKNPGLLLSVS